MTRESTDGSAGAAVAGERAQTALDRRPSLQSRLGSLLAVGLMAVLGFGMLAWYYSATLSRQERVRRSAAAAASQRAQGELPLPRLGRVDAPRPREPPAAPAPPATSNPTAPPRPPAPEVVPLLPEMALAPGPTAPATAMAPAGAPTPTPLVRRLSGAAFSPVTVAAAPAAAAPAPEPEAPAAGRNDGQSYLASWLKNTATPEIRAQRLPTQRLLLPKGAFIDCTLETAIDSTLPGMTTCVTATDTFGVDGSVVLLERGTKLIGETRGDVQQGSARVFVLWTEARTPSGVVVALDSPGADELGRAGLAGEVNRHFWQRFGAAMLVTVIEGAVQAAVQSSANGGAVIIDPSGSQQVLTDVLKGTINIPPTVRKRNGDRIQVLVARDLDFRSVYELRAAVGR